MSKIEGKSKVKDLNEAGKKLFKLWKKKQKEKKKVSTDEITDLLENAVETENGIKIVTACTETEATSVAGRLTKTKSVVAHIYDGKKLVSMASENIDIDLRKIAPEIGKILGGSGGGKTHMTQCGGPNKDKINEALEKAITLTKNILKN